MEKEEAVSLREAMEVMDPKDADEEEIRIHAAAQDEASELVWQHQHPEAAIQPDAPYRYKDHLRKNSYQHARTQSVGRYGGIGTVTGLARDITSRSVSADSSGSGEMHSQGSRVSSGSSGYSRLNRNISPDAAGRASMDSVATVPRPSQKSYGSISSAGKYGGGSRRRSSAKRNVSGEFASSFTGDQIWEEPQQDNNDRGRSQTPDMPAPLRLKPRNPLNRVQFVQDVAPRSSSTPPEPTKRLSRFEIHRNPPSQSKNPNYTANPLPIAKATEVDQAPSTVPMKDGLEIRSEEIRQATSMRLKDRSPKLPTPTVVSDKPGRPIVSFDANWKPKEADVKPEVRRRSPFDRVSTSANTQRQSLPAGSAAKGVSAAISSIHLSNTSTTQIKSTPVPVPTINFPDSTTSIPTINLPGAPSILTINLPDAPTIVVSTPAIPSISIQSDPTPSPGKRPLPDPKSSAGRPPPRHQVGAPVSRSHWSPAGKRATATCHQCQLPIEGRVVKLSGAHEHFHPHCFICFSCGTGLESLEIRPEPQQERAERINRIRLRAQGEQLPETEGQTMAEDGDERMRFYCHLDWHENFAPRCKHCKTPIIGEHMVALGENWHYGHFFCAECGDPFERGITHIEKDGYAWCLNCQTKRTERQAPKCKKCRKAVIGQYVQALGGEWHENCFRCATCKNGFEDGAFYPKEVGNETIVLCIQCIERELKA